jgi:hypothetical protein
MSRLNIPQLRLGHQKLLQTNFTEPAEVVGWLGAVQAQDFPGAKWALAQRMTGTTEAEIDRAFTDGSILRTHLLRPTWHFVTPKDIRWMLALTAPRVHALNTFYYRKSGLDASTLRRCRSVIAKTLKNNNHLTRTEIAAALEKAGVSTTAELRLAYIMMRAELDGLICSGPRRGRQFTYALLEERVPPVKELTRDESLAEIVRRYFSTRGPATLHDFAWWSGLTMADAKNGIELVKSGFVSEVIEGQQYWFSASTDSFTTSSPLAHLLPNYDEYFIGFKDRSAIGEVVRRSNVKESDPAFLANIIIIDGQIVGGWKREIKKDAVTVELDLITKLAKLERQAISAAAEGYGRFLGLRVELAWK